MSKLRLIDFILSLGEYFARKEEWDKAKVFYDRAQVLLAEYSAGM